MCFSSTASFTASAILAVIGISLLLKVKNPKLILLAYIPLFFAIQQASEGFVWLSLPEQSRFKYIFLFFAYVFWPIWIPIATWFAENNLFRKRILGILMGIGIVTGLILAMLIPNSSAIIYKSSVAYQNSTPFDLYRFIINVFYVISCVFPLFFSSISGMWILGSIGAISGAIIWWIDHQFAVSMWCFFAAIFSALLWFILPKQSH